MKERFKKELVRIRLTWFGDVERMAKRADVQKIEGKR